MSEPGSGETDEAARLHALFDAKVAAELDRADAEVPGSGLIASRGERFATVMLVKGDPGPAEVSGGAALSGPDGDAACKALEALGFDGSEVFATVARPEKDVDPTLLARRLRLQIEAVDPYAVVALDRVAGEVLANATGTGPASPGRPTYWMSRVLLTLDGLESSLADEKAKRRVWNQLKVLAPRRPTL